MKTSSKYRRLMRQRKLRRQRRAAAIILMVVMVFVANVAFSATTQSNDKYDMIEVVVEPGDTVWSIAKANMPAGGNLNEYVYEISANNGVKDGNIYVGQVLYIPVEL